MQVFCMRISYRFPTVAGVSSLGQPSEIGPHYIGQALRLTSFAKVNCKLSRPLRHTESKIAVKNRPGERLLAGLLEFPAATTNEWHFLAL